MNKYDIEWLLRRSPLDKLQADGKLICLEPAAFSLKTIRKSD